MIKNKMQIKMLIINTNEGNTSYKVYLINIPVDKRDVVSYYIN